MAADIDSIALDVARRFTEEWDPQRRASLQVHIVEAIRAALAARQPGAQADEAAILRHGAAVLDMWEGDPNVTGYMGDFKDACDILEVLALHAAPPAQGIDLGQLWEPIKEAVHTALSAHVSAMSQKKREQVAVYVARQLRDGQRDAAPGVGS